MKYANLRSLFCLSIFTLFSFVYAAQEVAKPLNAFVTLETNDFNLTITKSFIRAIKHEVICIVAVHIMYKLGEAKLFADARKMLEDPQKWSVFINDNKTFCVLIPKPYDDKLLTSRGFIQLEHIANDKITDYFSNQSFFSTSKDVQLQHDFKNLFSSQKVSKRFYLIGHGVTGEKIAGLSIEGFRELLDELSLIYTEFLYLASCFAAGSNLVALQQQQIKTVDRQFTLSKIEFPIVIQATAGVSAMGYAQSDFKTFFNNLNLFLAEKKRNYYLGRAPTGLTISEVIKPIIGSDPEATDLPSVRFPGTNSFFRAVTLDHVAIITDLMVKQLLTQPLFEQRYVPGAIKPAVPFIPISDQVKYILLYPTDCSAIKFVIPDKHPLPLFISKIPGSAQHYIGTIELGITQWESLLKESFLAPFIVYEEFAPIISYEFEVHPKAWFIEKVMSTEAHISGIIVYKPMMIKKNPRHIAPKLLYKDTNTNKYYLASEESLVNVIYRITWTPISAGWYALWARFIYETSRASAGALYEASGGLEDKTSEEKAFAHFKESMGIPFENLHYDDNDIWQATDYLLYGDSDLLEVASLLFQDLISKKLDLMPIANQLIKKNYEAPARKLFRLYIDLSAYDYADSLLRLINKEKSDWLDPFLSEQTTQKGIEFMRQFIARNLKNKDIVAQELMLKMFHVLVSQGFKEFNEQAVIAAQEWATSSDDTIRPLAFRLFELVVEKNIESDKAFEIALQGLTSQVESIRLYSESIILRGIEQGDATIIDKVINAFNIFNPIKVAQFVVNVIGNEKFTQSQLARLLEIIIQRIKPEADFTTLDVLGTAMFGLLSHKNIKISDKEISDIVSACRIIFKNCPDVVTGGFITQTKQEYIGSIIDKARALPIPSLADKLELMVKAEKLLP